VFYGSTIDGAASSTGERYADSENAFAYRKALRADCTCNGRDPSGLAPVDLTLDTSLRSGDVIALPMGWSPIPTSASAPARPPNLRPLLPIPALPPPSARGWVR
jgi:hypothetical protein